jgi:hypothetical protein
MMNVRVLIVAALALASTSVQAAQVYDVDAVAQQVGVNAVARSVSLMTTIIAVCPKHFPVDVPLTTRLRAATIEAGKKMSSEAWPGILRTEIARRRKEVAATGERMWCHYQRERPDLRDYFKL